MDASLNNLLAALTLHEKLEALRKYSKPEFDVNPWVVFTCLCFGAMLVLIFAAVRFYKREQMLKISENSFSQKASKFGLTDEESAVLKEIAIRSDIKDIISIFNLPAAFYKGSTSLLQEGFARGKSLDERKQIYSFVVSLKRKLGLVNEPFTSSVRKSKSKSLSSRQIPLGKKLGILKADGRKQVDVVIVESDDMTFRVCSDLGVLAEPGEVWKVRYRFGSSRWEFDSVVMECSNNQILFNHSDNIRFVNRRRFLRVNADYPAVIARFECSKTSLPGMQLEPVFIDAKVKELSGPGVKLEIKENYKIRERVIVSFRIDDSTVIQDVAEVRRCDKSGEAYDLAIELIGLDDRSVNRLVKATNHAALKFGLQFADEKKDERVLEVV